MRVEKRKSWIEARECFLEMADLEPLERQARLAELGARRPDLLAAVQRLLKQDPGEGEIEEPTSLVFGPYRSVRLIAVGGMGEVHLARRTDGEYEREVAIKSLRPGCEGEHLVQRFLRERQLLARMDHKYIARLLDGGRTERGHPYLVLEYVEGRHIDQHCQALGLDVPQRVTLFLKVLEAVGHAHAKGIVHRDLKPSNILVRHDGSPRLLDFGISLGTPEANAATANLTGTGQRLFTPEFASPEQIRGETASTASDVFSLGVVLYGLLAEVGPWEGSGSLHELERRVLERVPASPSDIVRGTGRYRISTDLSTIVLACLEKDPSRRLPSVQFLAEELERALGGFPIRTRPTRATTRVLRYAKRNPWQALAAITFLVAMLAGVVAWQYYERSSDQGALIILDLEQRLEYASNLGLQDRYQDAIPELLEVRSRLEGEQGLDALKIRVASDLAIAYLRTGEPRTGLDEAERGLAHAGIDGPEFSEERVALLLSASTACNWVLDAERAQDFAERSHALAQAELEPGHPKRIEAYVAFAGMTKGKGTLDERIEVLAAGLAEARQFAGDQDMALADILMFYGILLTEAEEYEAAVDAFDETVTIRRWNHGEGHAAVALVRSVRGNSLRLDGHWEAALADLEAAVATFRAGGHNQYLAPTLQHLGMLRFSMGNFETAAEDLASSKVLFSDLYGAQTPLCSYLEALKAKCLVGMESLEEARSSFELAFSADPGVGFQGWKVESELRHSFGCLLEELEDEFAAKAQFSVVLQIRSAEYGADDPRTQEVAERLSSLTR